MALGVLVVPVFVLLDNLAVLNLLCDLGDLLTRLALGDLLNALDLISFNRLASEVLGTGIIEN